MPLLSISEFESLVLKAFRGAGYSWGLSQEAGCAAAWLALRGMPSAASFAALLQRAGEQKPEPLVPCRVDGEWQKEGCPKCPVNTGAAISDFGWSAGNHIVVGPIYSPIILIPFVASCAKLAGSSLLVTIDGTEIILGSTGELCTDLSTIDISPVAEVSVIDREGAAGLTLVAQCRRALVDETLLQVLDSFAHLTYVPASDQSRSGAGAGLTDND